MGDDDPFVMPAKAGIQVFCWRSHPSAWIPAFAGMTFPSTLT
jgi:hypothetical protein